MKKLRKDSVFANLTEHQCEQMLQMSKDLTLEGIVKVLGGGPEPIHCSIGAVRRFIKRLEKERALESVDDNEDLVEDLSKRSKTPAVREATLQAMRERMFDAALESNNREQLMEIFQALKEEKKEERDSELEERKVKVAEENAKIGWRKLEYENARAGLKALPRIRELLTDGTRSLEERVAGSLQLLMQIDAANGLLLMEATSEPRTGVELATVAAPGPVVMKAAA